MIKSSISHAQLPKRFIFQKGLFLNHIELATVKMYVYFRKKKKQRRLYFIIYITFTFEY